MQGEGKGIVWERMRARHKIFPADSSDNERHDLY